MCGAGRRQGFWHLLRQAGQHLGQGLAREQGVEGLPEGLRSRGKGRTRYHRDRKVIPTLEGLSSLSRADSDCENCEDQFSIQVEQIFHQLPGNDVREG